MEIADWLRGLSLERYAETFRDNDIDAEVLLKLTAEDLINIGVTSVGHRRKLLDAIARLGMADPTAVVTVPALGAPAQVDAERRQLTVMFCDLVGSTALSTRHDPEDLRALIGDYHRAAAETVGRFDGFVAKYMGDGVLIYFGYPQAHEDDAERAVWAALAVIEAVGRLPAREDLRVRLGIATGLAVVGDLIGEGAAQERGVVGETPNLAARLQALATPNTVVIAEATRRQIGELFDLEDLGPQQLAGFAEPQRAWRVLGESGKVSRFEALRSGETPLVGRDEEIELLRRRWEQAKSGEGRVVLISGEPGIGKSRLTAALSAHIESEPHTRLRYFCSPHHQDSALYPFIAQLERAAGFARDDTVDAKLGKLRALLAPGTRDDDDIALLSELLSLPSSAVYLNLSPQRKREKLFEALLNQFEAEARHGPVLMVFEDAHWIDPTSRELLDLFVDRVRHLPVMLAITFRPEFQPLWGDRSYVMNFALNRLGERDSEALVHKLAGNAALTAEIVAEIVERTDGVPLFVEELTKAVLESAGQSDSVQDLLIWGPRMLQKLRTERGLLDVNSDQQNKGLEAGLVIDRATAARLGISTQMIDNTLYDAFGQRQVSTMYTQLNQYHVVLEVDPQFWQSPDSLKHIYVKTPSGTQVPLSTFTHYEPSTAPLVVTHQGQFPSVTLSFNLSPSLALGDAVAAVEQAGREIGLPASIHGSFQGTAQAFQSSLASEPLLIAAALLTVYIVLGVLYESMIHPITILSTLPSAGVGALLALLLCRTELSVIALIGIILLIGIVKKNAIMMIDFALEAERTEGKNPVQAIYQACLLRFRPIMMTTMAALLGALPLALGLGVGSELRRPLGIAIVGGLIFSQLLTLYTTPVIYLYLDRRRLWFQQRRARLARPVMQAE